MRRSGPRRSASPAAGRPRRGRLRTDGQRGSRRLGAQRAGPPPLTAASGRAAPARGCLSCGEKNTNPEPSTRHGSLQGDPRRPAPELPARRAPTAPGALGAGAPRPALGAAAGGSSEGHFHRDPAASPPLTPVGQGAAQPRGWGPLPFPRTPLRPAARRLLTAGSAAGRRGRGAQPASARRSRSQLTQQSCCGGCRRLGSARWDGLSAALPARAARDELTPRPPRRAPPAAALARGAARSPPALRRRSHGNSQAPGPAGGSGPRRARCILIDFLPFDIYITARPPGDL